MHKLVFALTALFLLVGITWDGARAATLHPVPGKVVVWGKGEAIYEAGPLPEEWLKKNPDIAKQLAGKKAGYKCKVFSLFWAVITKSDCKPVAFAGTQYYDETKIGDPKMNWIADLNKAIAAKYKESDVKMPFWAKFGKFVLGLILVVLVAGGIWSKVKSKD